MRRRDLGELVGRIVLAWALSSAVGLLAGRYIVGLIIPLLTLASDAISPYTTLIEYDRGVEGDRVSITAYVTRPIYVHHALTLNPGVTMTAAIDAGHVLVPLVILFTALWAPPVVRRRDRARLVVLGLPAACIVLCLTIPFVLIGKIEMMLIEDAAKAGELHSSLLVDWMIFGESGGIWLMPLVAAVLCAQSLPSAAGNENRWRRAAENSTKAAQASAPPA